MLDSRPLPPPPGPFEGGIPQSLVELAAVGSRRHAELEADVAESKVLLEWLRTEHSLWQTASGISMLHVWLNKDWSLLSVCV